MVRAAARTARDGEPIPLRPVDWTGEAPPTFPPGAVPAHVAIVMDGNGRWANRRGLPRVEGHKAGEATMLDVVAGAIQAGVGHLSLYAFSTENWARSVDEVRFLMGFNRDVLHRRRDQLVAWNVRFHWAGRRPRLWGSVIADLERTEAATARNTGMTLNLCVNYGGRNELVDAVQAIAAEAAAGRLKPAGVTARTIARHLYVPDMPDVDLFIRTSGEHRTSNFLLWQSAYAEYVFQDVLWPDYRRAHLWQAIADYVARDRRFGAAVDAPRQS
jgi:undecaprenyl diphosphate synthase